MARNPIIINLSLLMLIGGALFAQESEKAPEVFVGNMLVTSTPAAGASTRFTLNIDQYTSDEDLMKYIEILKAEGPQGLRKVLEKVQIGWIAPRGKLREPVNLARSRPIEGGRMLYILKTRYLNFLEFALGTARTREYDFTFMQIKLNEQGEGDGYLFLGTKIEINSENELSLEQYGTAPIAVRGVRLQK
jgi:hypothetical protein